MPERKSKTDRIVDFAVRLGMVFLAAWLFMLAVQTIGGWIHGVPGIGYWRAVWLCWLARAVTQFLTTRYPSSD